MPWNCSKHADPLTARQVIRADSVWLCQELCGTVCRRRPTSCNANWEKGWEAWNSAAEICESADDLSFRTEICCVQKRQLCTRGSQDGKTATSVQALLMSSRSFLKCGGLVRILGGTSPHHGLCGATRGRPIRARDFVREVIRTSPQHRLYGTTRDRRIRTWDFVRRVARTSPL